VGLRVTESGLSGSATASAYVPINIGNRAPVAAMVIVPSSPAPGQSVSLISSSYDPDGFIQTSAWDLDGDNKYDDAVGSTVTTTFTAGAHLVGLKVVDDFGAFATIPALVDAKATVGASGGSSTGAGGSTLVGVRLLSPFPIVRVSGIVQKKGTRVRVLSVNAPIGATVSVTCTGRGCPFRHTTTTVQGQARSSATVQPGVGLVSVKRFSRHVLRVGTAIRVFVTKSDAVGKYTRFKIRRGRSPARVDRCLPPSNLIPFPCPSS
jgi:hypothetical protein